MDRSEFEWALSYNEVEYMMEGTLEIKIGDRVISGHAGDVATKKFKVTIVFVDRLSGALFWSSPATPHNADPN
ncbi:hypothetical protein [Phosphitispora fastidiosa]|uniref:hypothetical protein n=1 Tax=Phosphitispora fastidiosa TaxID=2837202 RepID=UPI0022B16458|nr:hypothetical protein [Phosphitispora fastidiosa]